jgi:hypothetical protein
MVMNLGAVILFFPFFGFVGTTEGFCVSLWLKWVVIWRIRKRIPQ